jgi:hypothetical protein
MSEKVLSTQLLLRNGTLAMWEQTTKPLGKGEMAVVFCPDATTDGYITLLKVGDGVKLFSALPYAGMDISDIPLASASVNGLLSKEDFEKLAAIADEAQVNIIESVSVNGTALTITDKGVDITVPAGALADLDEVTFDDLAEALQGRITTLESASHTHTNATVLADIDDDKVSAWDAKLDKITGATTGDFVKIAVDGTIESAGVSASSFDSAGAAETVGNTLTGSSTDTSDTLTLYGIKAYVKARTEGIASTTALAEKADLVTNATDGNLAGLDEDGNLTDSGIAANNVVTKETGKGLSTNDFTTELKDKLDGIEDGAEANVLTDVKVDGVSVVTDKVANITMPTIVEYTIAKAATATTGYLATYQLKAGDTVVGEAINIPKDYLVKSAEVLTATLDNAADVGVSAGDTYIDFVVNTVGNDGQEDHIYLPVNDIVKPYGVDNAEDALVTLTLSADNKFSASIDLSDYMIADDIEEALDGKVDKVDGSRLMTTTEADKLDGIAEGAEVNVIEAIAGVTTTTNEKTVTITGISTDLLVEGTNTLVLDGGSASDLV